MVPPPTLPYPILCFIKTTTTKTKKNAKQNKIHQGQFVLLKNSWIWVTCLNGTLPFRQIGPRWGAVGLRAHFRSPCWDLVWLGLCRSCPCCHSHRVVLTTMLAWSPWTHMCSCPAGPQRLFSWLSLEPLALTVFLSPAKISEHWEDNVWCMCSI